MSPARETLPAPIDMPVVISPASTTNMHNQLVVRLSSPSALSRKRKHAEIDFGLEDRKTTLVGLGRAVSCLALMEEKEQKQEEDVTCAPSAKPTSPPSESSNGQEIKETNSEVLKENVVRTCPEEALENETNVKLLLEDATSEKIEDDSSPLSSPELESTSDPDASSSPEAKRPSSQRVDEEQDQNLPGEVDGPVDEPQPARPTRRSQRQAASKSRANVTFNGIRPIPVRRRLAAVLDPAARGRPWIYQHELGCSFHQQDGT